MEYTLHIKRANSKIQGTFIYKIKYFMFYLLPAPKKVNLEYQEEGYSSRIIFKQELKG